MNEKEMQQRRSTPEEWQKEEAELNTILKGRQNKERLKYIQVKHRKIWSREVHSIHFWFL